MNLIYQYPCQHKEINENKYIPPSTLTRRLKELQLVDLLKKNPITSNSRETHQYALTLLGMELMRFIHRYEKKMKLPIEQQKIIDVEK